MRGSDDEKGEASDVAEEHDDQAAEAALARRAAVPAKKPAPAAPKKKIDGALCFVLFPHLE